MKKRTKKIIKKVAIYLPSILVGLFILIILGGIAYFSYSQNGQYAWSIDNIKSNVGVLFPGLFGLNTTQVIIYKDAPSTSNAGNNVIETCSQVASKNNALFTEGITSSTNCFNHAKIECEQLGKTIEGYGFASGCCYYTCAVVVQQPVATCTDSDGGQDDQQFIKGTVTSSVGTFVDQCDWNIGGVTEYYCDGTTPKQTNVVCENYWSCQDGACKQQLCEDIMNPTPEKCASGYAPEGSTCGYWDLNGGVCLLSY